MIMIKVYTIYAYHIVQNICSTHNSHSRISNKPQKQKKFCPSNTLYYKVDTVTAVNKEILILTNSGTKYNKAL